MPKATLEFTLPEEANEHQLAVNGGKWSAVVRDFDLYLRNISKYDLTKPSLDEVRAQLHEFLDDYNLSLED